MMNMISANFFNFDPANSQKSADNTKNNLSEKQFAVFFDKLRAASSNASVTVQNAAPPVTETPATSEMPENAPICIKTSSANLTPIETTVVIQPHNNPHLPENDSPLPLPPPIFQLPQTPVATPPIIVAPSPENAGQVKNFETQTPPIMIPPVVIETPPIIEPPIVVITPPIMESPAPVETPPIIEIPIIKAETPTVKPPVVVQTPPIFELPVETPPILVNPQPTGKPEMPIETPPIIEMPPPAPPKIVPLNSNTKRIERNVEDTPPIVVLPTPQNAPPKIQTIKSNTKRTEINVQETPPIIVQPTNNGTIKNPKKDFTVPTIDLAAQRYVIAKETGKILRQEIDVQPPLTIETPPIIAFEHSAGNDKATVKPLMRDSAQILSASVAGEGGKDFTPILISNEIGAVSFETVTEIVADETRTPPQIHNVLYNYASPKYAADVKPTVVFPSEFQVKTNAAEKTLPTFETDLRVSFSKQFAESAPNVLEFRKSAENQSQNVSKPPVVAAENAAKMAEKTVVLTAADPEILTKSAAPKREAGDSLLESVNVLPRSETTNVKFETPEFTKANQTANEVKLSEQIELPLLELAVEVEQTKEKQILKMRLHPAELGTVEIHLEKNADGLMQARLSTETETARASLTENLDQLRSALEKAGWQIGAVEVAVSTASTSNFGGGQRHGENASQNQYQTFSQTESGSNFSQPETAQKDDHQHIVSLRA